MDAAAELGRNPVSNHQIQPEYGYGQADAGRDCRTRLETKFSGANADRGIFIFPVQLTTSRIGNLTRLIHTLAICDDHTSIPYMIDSHLPAGRADLLQDYLSGARSVVKRFEAPAAPRPLVPGRANLDKRRAFLVPHELHNATRSEHKTL